MEWQGRPLEVGGSVVFAGQTDLRETYSHHPDSVLEDRAWF